MPKRNRALRPRAAKALQASVGRETISGMDSPASSDGRTDNHEIIATFRYTLQPGADTDELQRLWNDMHRLATAAGMLGAELSKTKDDVLLMTYRFPSMRAMTSFTEHPAHRVVQKRGEEFFATLRTQVCMLVRESEFQP